MEAYKQEFIKFMVESDVLKFGSFTLKSGRQSPFFMNAGAYVTGYQLKKLGEYYAQAIHDNFGDDFDVLFGPAYKGIPLAVVTAIAYHELYGKEVKYCCDRKEAKDHGEGGSMVGYKPQDGDVIAIVEDVVTAGTAVRESIELFKHVADVKMAYLFVSVDRMERGTKECSTLDELRDDAAWYLQLRLSDGKALARVYDAAGLPEAGRSQTEAVAPRPLLEKAANKAGAAYDKAAHALND